MNHTEQFLADLKAQEEVNTNPLVDPAEPTDAGSDAVTSRERTVVDTSTGAKDGQNKCKKCGATDISYDIESGTLQCKFCHNKQMPEKFDLVNADISELEGIQIGSGADDIQKDAPSIITLKCQSCGAEVVINTAESTQSRCHWCRNTLSLNEQVPNGAVPDMVLPFAITKDQGKAELEKFVKKRRFYAHPKFLKEFSSDNIFGVYLPYMIVDLKANANMSGEGEILLRKYTEETGTGKNKTKTTYYDAKAYNISRNFDININDLSIEGSQDKLERNSKNDTKNVINAVMPFDVENSVKWDANFLKGYHSEKRDIDIDGIRPHITKQARDIARFKANETIKEYNRGVKWESDNITVSGERWLSAYFPIWLYSYQQDKGKNKKLLHYTAVNARTKETMGSIPLNIPKLLLFSFLIGIVCLIASFFVDAGEYDWLVALGGIAYYFYILSKYRNKSSRHYHEKETGSDMKNITGTDDYFGTRTRLRSPNIVGKNNYSLVKE